MGFLSISNEELEKWSNADINEEDMETTIGDITPKTESFFGHATITIRFENRVQWQKYRKYILKTDWEFDGGQNPYTAQLKECFETVEDVENITKKIVELLQLGFDVYSCKWELERENEQHVEYVLDGEVKRETISDPQ